VNFLMSLPMEHDARWHPHCIVTTCTSFAVSFISQERAATDVEAPGSTKAVTELSE